MRKKGLILFIVCCTLSYALTASILPVSAMLPAERVIESRTNRPIALPFLIHELPLSLECVEIKTQYNLEAPYGFSDREATTDHSVQTITYTVKNKSETVQTADIYFPMDSRSFSAEYFINQEPFECWEEYLLQEPPSREEAPSGEILTHLIERIQQQQAPYPMTSISLKDAGSHYTLVPQISKPSKNAGQLYIRYNPAKTTLLLKSAVSFAQKQYIELDLPKYAEGISHYVTSKDIVGFYDIDDIYQSPEEFLEKFEICTYITGNNQPIELLVLGEDDFTVRFHAQDEPMNTKGFDIEITCREDITAEEFIGSIPPSHYQQLLSDKENILRPKSLPLYLLDQLLSESSRGDSSLPEDLLWERMSFVNLLQLSNTEPNQYQSSSQVLAHHPAIQGATYNFLPGETATIQVISPVRDGFQLTEKRDSYQFYQEILMESADTWESYGSLSHEITFGANDIVSDFNYPLGWEEKENAIHYSLPIHPQQEIQNSFSLAVDVSHYDKTNWPMFFLVLGILALRFWPITLLILILLIYVIRYLYKKHKKKNTP